MDFSWGEIEHSIELRNPCWLFDFSPGEIQNVIFLPRGIHTMLEFSPGEFQHSMIAPGEKYEIPDFPLRGYWTAKGNSAFLVNVRFLPKGIPALYDFSWGEILQSGFILGRNRAAKGDSAFLLDVRFLPRRIPALYDFSWGEIWHSGLPQHQNLHLGKKRQSLEKAN